MMAVTTFRSWTSTPTINALPVIKFVSICCCWYAVGASMKEWRYSLTTLTKTSRERSWANPLPCSLLSGSTSAVAFVSQQLPFGSGNTKCAECCGIVKLPHINREWLIKRMDPTTVGVKKTDQSYHFEQWVHMQHVRSKGTKSDRRRHRSSPEAQSRSRSRDESWFLSFFCCLSAVCQSSHNYARVFRMLVIDDFFHGWFQRRLISLCAVRRAFFTWCR